MAKRLLASFLILFLALSGNARAVDDDGDGIDDVQEMSLIEAHAPYLYFHPEERYFPTSVEFALDNSVLERYNDGGPPILVDANPTAASLAAHVTPADPFVNPGDIFYLNNTLGTTRDDADLHAAYTSGAYPRTVYAHVTDVAGQTVVQFWFYYAYNPGVWNNHEGDWEMVEVVLTAGAPTLVGYSQHFAGERMSWSDVEKEGTHPKAYVARGSHASYLRPYQGRFGIAGDAVSDAGPVWTPTDYTVVNVGERDAPLPGQEWLRFAGRWGEFFPQAEVRAEAGPPGPGYREDGRMFLAPVAWANDQPIPDLPTLVLNWFLANLLTIFVLLVLLSLAVKLVRLWRLQRATNVGIKMWPYAHLKPVDRKTVAMFIALVGLAVGIAGFLLPWYVMTLDVNAPGFLVTDGPEEFLRVDGLDGVSVNPMKAGGVVRVSVLPFPLGLLLVITTLYFFLRIAGTKTTRRLGVRFIAKGVVAVLPFVFVIVIAALLLPGLEGDPGQFGAGDLVRPVAASPFGGSKTVAVEDSTGTLSWGLGIGSWLLVASAAIMFLAGGLALSQRYAFLPQWYVDGLASPAEAVAAAGGPEGGLPPPPPPLAPPWPEGGTGVPGAGPPPEPPAGQPPPPFCTQCGAPLQAGASACGNCGQPVP